MPPAKKSTKTDKSKKDKEPTKAPATEAELLADRLRAEGIVVTFATTNKLMHKNQRDIAVDSLTMTFHGTPLLEDTSLSLNYGNRYGLIGRNGCGKSTFMKVIGSRCFPIPDGIDIFHLHEEIEATEMTALEAVMSVDKERAKLELEAEQLNDKMADESAEDQDDLMDRLNQIYERLEQLDATTAEVRASRILFGLGFTTQTLQKKTK